MNSPEGARLQTCSAPCPWVGLEKLPMGCARHPFSICGWWNGICQHKTAEQPSISFPVTWKGFPFKFSFLSYSWNSQKQQLPSSGPIAQIAPNPFCAIIVHFVHCCKTILRCWLVRLLTYPSHYYSQLITKQQPAIPMSSSCRFFFGRRLCQTSS